MTALPAVESADNFPSATPAGGRFTALDVFRGLTVCVMIVVNTLGPGPHFDWAVHAPWFGFTLADWVFPSFLFAVGAAMSFTIRKAPDERAFLMRTGRRTALIFLLGFLMYWYPFVHLDAAGHLVGNPLGETRIMGVLQRIALCFGTAALAARYLPERWLAPLCAAILLAYWAILLVFGKPGEALIPFGNAAGLLDRAILGAAHMYHSGERGYDPEGLLSTIPAVVNTLAGYLTGRWLLRTPDKAKAALQLLLAGAGLIVLALLWALAFPLAKRIWTSSYALLTIGIDLTLIAALIAYIDVGKQRIGVGFFEVFGKNPLVIYLVSELFIETLQIIRVGEDGQDPYEYLGWHVFQATLPGPAGSLACAIAYMLVCWLLGFALKRANLVIRI